MKNTELATVHKDDLSLVDNNMLNQNQLSLLLKSTPQKYIHKRPAKGGGEWDYVTIGYVTKVLNLMFGWDWDFEIVDERIEIEAKEVIVKGRLTCRTDEGKQIVKMQFGNKDVMFKKGTNIPLSIGNDLKAAASDALKKCASEIGVAADVYNKTDFAAIKVVSDNVPKEHLAKLNECKSMEEVTMLYEGLPELQGVDEWEKLVTSKYNKFKVYGTAQ